MIIAIDFDGTCVTHAYPKIGKDIGAVPVLKQLVQYGHQLILWTMRSNKELDEAVNWFMNNKIPLYGINHNSNQYTWTTSPKVYAQLYIDDAAFGAPLLFNKEISDRPYIDWDEIAESFNLNSE